jgi:FdhE protein
MTRSAWPRRIDRAEKLATLHPPVAEMLHFYIEIARFQQDLYRELDRVVGSTTKPSANPSQLPVLEPRFKAFLAAVEPHAPPRLFDIAYQLRSSEKDSRSELLDAVWVRTDVSPSQPQEFLALAFLQPYAELLRARANLNLNGYTHALCPFCSRKPGVAILRQQGDGGRRSLLCSFCMAEWEFRRVVCVACGEENDRKLPVYTAAEFDYIRVDCCDTCKTYIKAVDLTKNGLAEPLVDEIAAAALDLWAKEHGYAKLQPNPLGL